MGSLKTKKQTTGSIFIAELKSERLCIRKYLDNLRLIVDAIIGHFQASDNIIGHFQGSAFIIGHFQASDVIIVHFQGSDVIISYFQRDRMTDVEQ